MKSNEEIIAIYKAGGIDTSKPIINTCGSGMTACVNDLALNLIGHTDLRLYDGSWTEYG